MPFIGIILQNTHRCEQSHRITAVNKIIVSFKECQETFFSVPIKHYVCFFMQHVFLFKSRSWKFCWLLWQTKSLIKSLDSACWNFLVDIFPKFVSLACPWFSFDSDISSSSSSEGSLWKQVLVFHMSEARDELLNQDLVT